jgi:hypothetical protein
MDGAIGELQAEFLTKEQVDSSRTMGIDYQLAATPRPVEKVTSSTPPSMLHASERCTPTQPSHAKASGG